MLVFTLAWALNRAVQSGGWPGLVKVTSRWFPCSSYGAVMGVLSLSFLFGDFLSRLFLGQLVSWGVGWRGLFLAATGTLALVFIANLLFLREGPEESGVPEPEANPANLFGEKGQSLGPASCRELLRPLFGSGLFWAVCALSLGFTLVRETFNTWTPEYLTEVVGLSAGAAGKASSLFPLFGGLSVLAAGSWSDRLGRSGRACLILFGLLLSVPALLALGYLPFHHSAVLPVLLLGAVAFLLMGPYSFLAGAIALDFGGKRGSATVSGLVDGVGYVGGALAGQGIGTVVERHGWGPAFLLLATAAGISCVVAAAYLWMQAHPSARPAAQDP